MSTQNDEKRGTSEATHVGEQATKVPSEAFLSGFNAGRNGPVDYDVRQAWSTFLRFGGDRPDYAPDDAGGEYFKVGDLVMSDDDPPRGPWKVIETRTVRQIRVEYRVVKDWQGQEVSHTGGFDEAKFYRRADSTQKRSDGQ